MRFASWYTSPLPYDTVRRLSRALGMSEVTAAVLARRGYTDAEDALRFLDSDGVLHDPFLFPQMQAARERLLKAVTQGEKICIHGDYDVDGITSTALLVYVLRDLGADVTAHLPNRFTEGYGIAMPTVERIAADGAGLLVTVDCGIGARAQIARAAEIGMDSIVIDHHRPVEADLPAAITISPLLCDYPFKDLAGVGLAFKVAQALLENPDKDSSSSDLQPELARLLDLVALGTIADVVPLIDENRALVRRGLVQLARTGRPGLTALMRVGQVEPSRINAGLVAFRMAPRLNAAGRMEDPGTALELLLTGDEREAEELATRLDNSNRERQRIENKMLAEARKMIGEWPDERREKQGYVLSSPGWHEGVIGIVASRLVEIYRRPVVMIAEDQEQAIGKGSGRSVDGFDLHEALSNLSGQLASFGGHRVACGLSINLAQIGDFTKSFADLADAKLAEAGSRSSRFVDSLVCGRELTLDLAQELSRLEPFGAGNPSVELLVTGARIKGERVTRDGQHLQCLVEAGGARSKAIGFGQAFLQEKLKTASDWDVAFQLERNEFNGSVSPQLQLREVFPQNGRAPLEMAACGDRCDHDCQNRVSGNEFWGLLDTDLEIPTSWLTSAGDSLDLVGKVEPLDLEKRLSDRRNFGGISAQIARLMTSGENILLLTADVARRRRLLSQGLPIANIPTERVMLASSRCGSAALEKRLQKTEGSGPLLMLADFTTASALPQLVAAYKHIVFIDPPWNHRVFDAIISSAPSAYVHLFYCSDEVQFTGKVLENEYDLRGQLTRLYRRLEAGKTYPFNETTERLLLAGGKYLRQPVLIARCLRILKELSLISIVDGADEPILSVSAAKRTELDQSPTYMATQSFYRKCLQFLSKSLNAKVI